MRVCLVFVVFQNVDNRQLPYRRDVQGFVKGSLFRSAVPKKAVHHLACFLHLGRQSYAGCMCDAGANDPSGPGKMMSGISQMHRSAKTSADAIVSAVQFRHYFLRGCAKHDRITMTPVARHHRIAVVSRGQRADNRSFGSVAEMCVPANHPRMLNERALYALLEFADAYHLRPHPDQAVLP